MQSIRTAIRCQSETAQSCLATNDFLHLVHFLRSRRKVVVAGVGDQDVVCQSRDELARAQYTIGTLSPYPPPPLDSQNVRPAMPPSTQNPLSERKSKLTLNPNPPNIPILPQNPLVNKPFMLRIPQIRLDNKPAKIHPRLHRNDAPSRQRPSHPQITEHRIRIRIIRIPARIMRVHPEIVSQAVGEKRNAGPRGKDVLRHALQDPQPQQAHDGHAVRVRMHVVPAHASPQHRDALLLHPQHDIVDGGALDAEGAREGERARDVRRVARDLGASVEQQVQLARERLVVADVM